VVLIDHEITGFNLPTGYTVSIDLPAQYTAPPRVQRVQWLHAHLARRISIKGYTIPYTIPYVSLYLARRISVNSRCISSASAAATFPWCSTKCMYLHVRQPSPSVRESGEGAAAFCKTNAIYCNSFVIHL
jgi:hypothetical protein